MTAKTLEVALKLNLGNMRAGLGAAAGDVKAFGQSLNEAIPEHHQTKLDKLGSGALVMGGAMLAGFGLAAKSAMDFDKQLSELAAVSGASGAALDALREQAINAGAATVFSAGEAAQAQVELSKAGVSTADILGGALTGALNLASAGSLDLATAAAIAAQTMTTFGLKGSDVGRIADALAAGANKSAADVSTLAQGLAQSGLVANQFGLSMEETVGTLSLFSQNALNGSDAGTSLKTMLTRLGAPTAEAKTLMDQLGISFYDSSGGALNFADVADNLQGALSGMTEEQRNATLTTLFGADAIRAANIVYKAGGDGIRDWTASVSEQGYAAGLAAEKTDNLAGDLESLKGTIETALIQTGEKGQGALRSLTQGLNDTVIGFTGLSSGAQNTILAIAGIGSTAAVVAGGIIKLKAAVQDAGLFKTAGLASFSLPILAATTAVGIFGKYLAESGHKAAEAQGRIDAYVQSAGNVDKALNAQKFAASDLAKNLDQAGVNWDDFTAAIENGVPGLDKIEQAIQRAEGDAKLASESTDAYVASLGRMALAGQISPDTFRFGIAELRKQIDAQKGYVEQTKIANSLDPASAEGKKNLATQAKRAAEDIDALKESLNRLVGAYYGEQQAQTALHREINATAEDAKAFVEAGGKMANVMTDTSEEALNLQDDLANLADKNTDLAKGWVDAGIRGQELTDKVNFLAQGMYQFAIAQGFPEAEAAKLRDTLLTIPQRVDAIVGTPGAAEATGEVSGLHGWLSSLPPRVDSAVGTPGATDATGQVAGLHGWLSSLPKSVSTPVSAPGADNLLGTIADLKARLDRLGGSSAHPEIQALIDQGSFNQANTALNNLARDRISNVVANVTARIHNTFGFAGGGIIAAAARGLEVGPHSAELAGPGAVRWREPDTQGEGYVPFANDWRRPGAQRVWGQIGRRIGMLGPVPVAPTPQAFAGVPAASGGDHYSFVMPVSVSVPNYVGDKTEFNRAVVSAVKSSEPTMKAALAEAVRRTAR